MPVIGESKVIGNLVRLNKTPGSVKGPAPELGEDTAEVMSQLGFSDEDIKGVIERADLVRNELIDASEQN
jgi:crotonobetainyl-CoA:carnitine CoA-transferase CaiB-like acyl-CoA transferase